MLRLHDNTFCSASNLSDTLRSLVLALPSERIRALTDIPLSKDSITRILVEAIGVEHQNSRYSVDILGSDGLENGEVMVSEWEAQYLESYLGDPRVLFVSLQPARGQYIRQIPMPDAADVAYWRGAIQLLSLHGPGLAIASPVSFDTEVVGVRGADLHDDALRVLGKYLQGLQLISTTQGEEGWDPVSSFGYRFLQGLTNACMPAEYKFLYRSLFQIHAWGEVLAHACDSFFQENPFGLLINDPEGITSMLVDDADESREGSFFMACVYPENLITVLRALMMQEKIMEALCKSESRTLNAGP